MTAEVSPAALILPAAVVAPVLLWLAMTGRLSRRAFDDAPRAAGLPSSALLMGGALWAFGQFAAIAIIQSLGWTPPGHADPSLSDQGLASGSRGFLLMVLISQLVGAGPLVIWTLVAASAQPGGLADFGFHVRRPVAQVLRAIGGLLFAFPAVSLTIGLIAVTGMLLGFPPPPAIGHDMLKILHTTDDPLVRWGIVLSAIAIAPVAEEVIYRGLVHRALRGLLGGMARWRVILMASLLFALIHFSVPAQLLPGLFVLSVIMGWLYERHGSLWTPILVHAGFNAINVLVVLWLMSEPAVG